MEISAFFTLLLAFTGFIVASHIYHKAKSGEKLVCYIGSGCDEVIRSEYAKFLGIPNAAWGIFYYLVIIFLYGQYLIFPGFASPIFSFIILVLSAAAFLFSVYLTLIQGIILRQWCEWCLASALICVSIFTLIFAEYNYNLLDIISYNLELITIMHIFAAAIGVGGATITDVLFLKFLKDFKISKDEAEVLRVVAQVIWAALAVLYVTGAAIYFTNSIAYSADPKFLMKTLVIGVVTVVGFILNLMIAPKLITMSFGERRQHEKGEFNLLRKVAFAFGATSLVSWYSVFVLGALQSAPYDFKTMFLIYLGIVAAGVLSSQLMEYEIERQSII